MAFANLDRILSHARLNQMVRQIKHILNTETVTCMNNFSAPSFEYSKSNCLVLADGQASLHGTPVIQCHLV